MRLDQYLSEKGLRGSEFASLIGVTEETVRRYLKGERKPEWRVLEKIRAATSGDVTADDFHDLSAPAGAGGDPEPVRVAQAAAQPAEDAA